MALLYIYRSATILSPQTVEVSNINQARHTQKCTFAWILWVCGCWSLAKSIRLEAHWKCTYEVTHLSFTHLRNFYGSCTRWQPVRTVKWMATRCSARTTRSLFMNLSVQALLLDANNTASLARELFKCGVSSNSQHYSTWARDLFNQEWVRTIWYHDCFENTTCRSHLKLNVR